MWKNNSNKIWLFCCILMGCASSPRVVDPTILQELRGEIRPDKIIYQIDEPIVVKYTLANISEKALNESVIDGSKDPKVAFQSYFFNAVAELDRTEHLALQESSPALQGPLTLQPGEEQLFCENKFIGSAPGAYVLSFFLQWKGDKKIAFKPVSIQIAAKQEIAPELQAALLDLESSDTQVRLQAREKLKSIGGPAAGFLIPLLGHKDDLVARDATSTLVGIGSPAVPSLIKATKDPNSQIRFRAVYALTEIGDFQGIPIIRDTFLHDPNPDVRMAALKGVADLAPQIAAPLLVSGLEDANLDIRTRSFEILQRMTGQDFDFKPNAPLEEQQKSIKLWKKWVEKK